MLAFGVDIGVGVNRAVVVVDVDVGVGSAMIGGGCFSIVNGDGHENSDGFLICVGGM